MKRLLNITASKSGFVLPSLIVFSVSLMIVGLVVMQYIASSTSVIQSSYFMEMARKAAEAGAQQALTCLQASDGTVTWSSSTLAPGKDCSGATIVGAATTFAKDDNGIWEVTYSVGNPTVTLGSGLTASSMGTVQFKYNGAAVSKTYTQSVRLNIPYSASSSTVYAAQGQVVTQVSAGEYFTCAIANQTPYCWGSNSMGKTGNGSSSPSNVLNPTMITTGDINGLRAYDVQASVDFACGLANGRMYCWGANNQGQLGMGSTNGSVNSPKLVASTDTSSTEYPAHTGRKPRDMYGRNVTQMTVSAPTTLFAGLGDEQHYACAVADTKGYCWGQDAFAQLGQPWYNCTWLIFTWNCSLLNTPQIEVASTDHMTPTAVFGMATTTGPSEGSSNLSGRRLSAIRAGQAGTCAETNGQIYCWGGLYVPASGPVCGASMSVLCPSTGGMMDSAGWKSNYGSLSGKKSYGMTVGGNTGCAISNGTAHCWGSNKGDGGSTFPIFDSDNPVAVTSNGLSTKAVTSVGAGGTQGPVCLGGGGDLYCWSSTGKIGNTTPTLVNDSHATGLAVTQATGGYNHGCMIANGAVYCAGRNDYAQLGNGATNGVDNGLVKTTIIGTSDPTSQAAVTDVTAGSNHACAVANGNAYCWGDNTYGQLGVGDTTARIIPTNPLNTSGSTAISKISAGTNFTCSIVNGDVYCWGDNTYGQLGQGNNTNTAAYLKPVKVAGGLSGKRATAISTGNRHVCAVADSSIYCWGDNTYGQLGYGNTAALYAPSMTPVNVGSGVAASRVSAGGNTTCAVADQTIKCWGSNSAGQLGMSSKGVTGTLASPANIDATYSTNFTEATDVAVGDNFACGILRGYPYCWGDNTNGRLGHTSSASTQYRVQQVVSPLINKNIISISAGKDSACAVANGSAYCWGNNNYGQLGNNTTTSNQTPQAVTATSGVLGTNYPTKLSVGNGFVCTVANGRIACWGNNASKQLGLPSAGATSLVPIMSNTYYSRELLEYDYTQAIMY